MTAQPFTAQERYVRGIRRAYSRGREAALAKETLAQNPYSKWDHRKSWEDGWHEGQKAIVLPAFDRRFTLTRAQIDGLRRIRDRGPLAWCHGLGRAGGAVSRMFGRMTDLGLCTAPPHNITKKGRATLAALERAKERREARR